MTPQENEPEHSSSHDPARWVDEHGDALFAYAMSRLHDANAAEDIVQETLVTAIERLPTFEGRSTLRTWLIGILRYKLLQRFNRSTTVSLDQELPPSIVDQAYNDAGGCRIEHHPWNIDFDSPESVAELNQAIANCIDQLPKRAAEAFLLIERHGVPTDEICKMLNVTKTNLYVILFRAKTALRLCLEKRFAQERRDGGPDATP